jgi:ABC-type antimicrobial peptide transport system permease subunit
MQTVNQSASGSDLGAVNSLSNIYPNSSQNLYDVPAANQLADTPLPVKFANINSISAGAATIADVPQAIREITSLLHERHHIKDAQPDDFVIRDMTEQVDNYTDTSTKMTNLLLAVALISLVVGGVGIMNIMLVSVTERTREIGLRMAVGARGSDILAQFLVEAVSLCLLGGLIGILLGRGASWFVHRFLGRPTEVSIEAIVASVVVSAMVGVAFGFYPAWKASRLDPIEALRFE